MKIRSLYLMLVVCLLLNTTTARADDAIFIKIGDTHEQIVSIYPELSDGELPRIHWIESYSLAEPYGIATNISLQYDESPYHYNLSILDQNGAIDYITRYIPDIDILEQCIASTASEKDPAKLQELAFTAVKEQLNALSPGAQTEEFQFLEVEVDEDYYRHLRETYNSVGIENIFTLDVIGAVGMYFYAPFETALFAKNQLLYVTWDSIYNAITEWRIYPLDFEFPTSE